jgi:histone-lysine N-methyltransferase SETMAR
VRVTGGETRVLFVNVETKKQSKHWIHAHAPNKPKKFKQTSSARKPIAAVYWDREGVLMAEFMQQGTTMSEVYCRTLKKLLRAIQIKWCGILTSGIVLLHDNARPNSAACTEALLEHFSWELLDHPPYSPELSE